MSSSTLDRAGRLARRGRYAELICLLEPQVPIYRDSHRFYYLLGLACLRTGDGGGASAYLRRAEQLDPEHLDTLLGLAALDLKRGEMAKAIEVYLHVLEARPGDRLATSALRFIREKDSEERIPQLVNAGKFDRFYPKPTGLPPIAIPIAMIACAAVALALLFPVARGLYVSAKEARSPRPAIAAVNLSEGDRAEPVVSGGSYRYILTEKAALDSFEKAKSFFQSYRDNAALIELNRLLGSNASPSIKEKAKILKGFVSAPDFRTVKDVPGYAELSRDPALFESCAVLWKGRAANIESEPSGAVSFDFLVGYEDKKSLDGIVPVDFGGIHVNVAGDRPLELLAIVRTQGGTGLRLEAVAIHELSDH